MRQTKSFTVDRDGSPVTYACTQLGAWDGSKALIRAQKIAVKGINGLDAMIEAMTPQDLEYFAQIFSKVTVVTFTNGKNQTVKKTLSEVFDVFFAGHYFELTQWLVFCLAHDFGPFFSSVQTSGDKIKSQWLAGLGKSEGTEQAPTPDQDDE